MDYNSDDRYQQHRQSDGYYNQPVHRPYGQGFLLASVICGLLSIPLGCIAIGLPLGALGVFFALLTYRRGKRMNFTAKMGLFSSVFGIVMSAFVMLYVYITMPVLLRSEEYKSQMELFYNSLPKSESDIDFEEFWKMYEDFYGVSAEE